MQNFQALSVQPGSLVTNELTFGGQAFTSTDLNAGLEKFSMVKSHMVMTAF